MPSFSRISSSSVFLISTNAPDLIRLFIGADLPSYPLSSLFFSFFLLSEMNDRYISAKTLNFKKACHRLRPRSTNLNFV